MTPAAARILTGRTSARDRADLDAAQVPNERAARATIEGRSERGDFDATSIGALIALMRRSASAMRTRRCPVVNLGVTAPCSRALKPTEEPNAMDTTARLIASRRVPRDTHDIVIRIYRIPNAKPGEPLLEVTDPEDAARVVTELHDLAEALAAETLASDREIAVRGALLRRSRLLQLATERAPKHDSEALHDLVVAYSEYRESVVGYLRTVASGGRP